MELGLISIRRIKCTVLILLVCMQTSIAAYSQRVTLNVRSSSLETILDNIQTQTGYLVLYNNEQVKNLGKIRVNIKNLELDAAMKTVLNGLPLTYAIQGETILIKPSPMPHKETSNEKTLQQTVSGKVVNERGQPLAGVSVSTTNRTNSTQTNEQGTFQLQD